jgi:Ca2+-binding EF-hand superfamily protein
VINYTLKQKFDLYDEDGSGTISVNELEKLIVDSFSEEILKMENTTFQQVYLTN